jgi:hypothetical protein
VRPRIGQREQRPVLSRRARAEIVSRAWNVRSAKLSHALPAHRRRRVERVEAGTDWRVHAPGSRARTCRVGNEPLARWARGTLDPRQVRFESHLVVVGAPIEKRAGEHDRCGVELAVELRVGEGSWPGVLVLGPVEIDVCAKAPADPDPLRCFRALAGELIPVGSGRVRGARTSTGGVGGVDVAAVLKVPDLIRERDVVGVRRLRDAGVHARGRVHRVEVGRNVGARGPGRRPLDLAEPIRGAGRHRACLATGEIGEPDLESIRCISHRH